MFPYSKIQVDANVFAPTLAAFTSTAIDLVSRRRSDLFIVSRKNWNHEKRLGIRRRRRCGNAICVSIRLPLFVSVRADEESRSFSINAPSRETAAKLYLSRIPSVYLPRGRRVFINLRALRYALIVRKWDREMRARWAQWLPRFGINL